MPYFYTLTAACGVIPLVCIFFAYRKHRDSLHPLMFIGPMLIFLYCVMPLQLETQDELRAYLTEDDLAWVQFVNCGGVAAICLGMLFGGYKPASRQASPNGVYGTRKVGYLRLASLVLGFLGVAGFAAGIVTVGGLSAAYGQAYGGGWSESGYVRESMLLTLPAVQIRLMPSITRNWFGKDGALTAAIAAPLLLHGALGARRGPLFMVLVGTVTAWYLWRQRRPALTAVFVGSALMGALLLTVVANRDNIYLGSEKTLDKRPTEYLRAGTGNEFIFGSGLMLDAARAERVYWGARYFVIVFVRPIPRFFWPEKYADASRMFSIPNLDEGLESRADFSYTLGWVAAAGAAGGLIADMFEEFSYVCVPVLFLIGWIYGRLWRRAITNFGRDGVLYCLSISLSLYLVMQTLEAMLFRFILLSVPVAIIWKLLSVSNSPRFIVPARGLHQHR